MKPNFEKLDSTRWRAVDEYASALFWPYLVWSWPWPLTF